ncbi:MAG: peroxiredoxin [Candidatus Gracilibacteria bacterium]
MSCCENNESLFGQVKIDIEAPGFNLPAYDPLTDDETIVSSGSLAGKWIVLFFYPADFTFVCPTELKDMADARDIFETIGVEVLTVSTDTVYSHRAWVKHERLMQNFPYKMLSDHNLEIADAYNVLDEQTGIAGRGTFVIDPDGITRVIEITSGPLGRNSEELIRKIEALQHMRANPGIACPARWVKGNTTLTPSIKIAGEVYEALNK